MGAMSRDKGAAAEREIVGEFHYHGWKDATRTHDGRAQHGRGDVAHGPAGVHVEIKRQERLNVAAAFDQIRHDTNAGDMPLLIHRPSRCEWMATMPLDDALALLALKERG